MGIVNESKRKAREIVANHEHRITTLYRESIPVMSPSDAEFEIAILLKKIAKLEGELKAIK